MTNNQSKTGSGLNVARWIARILSTLCAVFFGLFIIGGSITEFQEGGSLIPSGEGIPVFLTYIVVLTGTIIGWWKEKIGAILLIIGYLGFAIGGYFIAGTNRLSPAFMFLPFLISGILYYVYRTKIRK